MSIGFFFVPLHRQTKKTLMSNKQKQLTIMEEKKFWLINVPGRHGYSMLLHCNAETEEDAIDMASDADLFNDGEDAEYATCEEADDYTIKHFVTNNMAVEL